MSYDDRTESVHINRYTYSDYFAKIDPKDAKNQFILKWWTDQHDMLLAEEIINCQWLWYSQYDRDPLLQKIIKITPSNLLKNWIDLDPLCILSYDSSYLLNQELEEKFFNINIDKRIRTPTEEMKITPFFLDTNKNRYTAITPAEKSMYCLK